MKICRRNNYPRLKIIDHHSWMRVNACKAECQSGTFTGPLWWCIVTGIVQSGGCRHINQWPRRLKHAVGDYLKMSGGILDLLQPWEQSGVLVQRSLGSYLEGNDSFHRWWRWCTVLSLCCVISYPETMPPELACIGNIRQITVSGAGQQLLRRYWKKRA